MSAKAVVAHDGLGHEQLHLGATVGQRGEDQLARVAQADHPAGDADLDVGLACPARGRRPASRTSAAECVRSKRYGYGSTPAARRSSTWPCRRARSAASPLPVSSASAASSVALVAPSIARRYRARVSCRRSAQRASDAPAARAVLGALRSTAMATHLRDHRRRPGRQHGRHLRRAARRRGHDGRARRRSAAPPTCWDCIPSKTMIATGGAMSFLRRSHRDGPRAGRRRGRHRRADRRGSRASSRTCRPAPRSCCRARACA